MKIVVTGGSGKAGRAVVADLLEARPRRPERRPGAVGRVELARLAGAVPARRPDRRRPGARGGRRRRPHAAAGGGRAPGRDPLAGARHPVRRLPQQHPLDARRLRRRRPARPRARRLGVQRDDARAAVRAAARLRAGRRGARAPARVALRALEGARRGDGPPVQPLERDPVRRAPLLEHHGARRLRAVPVLLGGSRSCASGTCGATSTRATSARASASRSRPTSAERTRSSSPPPTP